MAVLLPTVIAQYRREIESELQAIFAGRKSTPKLYGMIEYHLGFRDENLVPARVSSGKYLRPVFCLLSAEAVGGDYEKALPAACSLELVHNFSLVHDDIQDRGAERHHRPTVWKIWGEAQGIDAGDAALILAELALLESKKRGVPAEIVLAAIERLNEASLRLAEGQHLDIGFEGKIDLTESEYLEMIGGKTAALLGLSLELGALIGSEDASLAASYRALGEELGVAFQVQDDLLGIWGDPKRTGKPWAADVYEHKMTLPVIYALRDSDEKTRFEIASLYSRSSLIDEESAKRASTLLESTGAREKVEQVATGRYNAARSLLDSLAPEEPAGSTLRALGSFLLGRDY